MSSTKSGLTILVVFSKNLMRARIALLSTVCLLIACGPKATTAPPSPAAGPSPQSETDPGTTQTGAGIRGDLCTAQPDPEDAELQLVYSDEHDWAMYTGRDAMIDCTSALTRMDLGDGTTITVGPWPNDTDIDGMAQTMAKGMHDAFTLETLPAITKVALPGQTREARCYESYGTLPEGPQAGLRVFVLGCLTREASTLHHITWVGTIDGERAAPQEDEIRQAIHTAAGAWNLASVAFAEESGGDR